MKQRLIIALTLVALGATTARAQQPAAAMPVAAGQPQQQQQQASPLETYRKEKATVPYKTTHKATKQRRVATRKGNRELKKDNHSNAVTRYRDALTADSSYSKAQYNLAIAHGKLNQKDSALAFYRKVCDNTSTTPAVRAKAHYNAGNIHLCQALAARDTGGYDGQSLRAAIEQYKASLRLESHNGDAQHNLSLARQLLRDESQNGNGGQNQDQQQNQNQQQNQDQQQQNQDQQQKQDQQQQKQGDQDQQQKQDKQEQKQDKQQEQKRREAEQMLNAMKNNEQQTMKAVRMKEADKERRKGSPSRIEKDW